MTFKEWIEDIMQKGLLCNEYTEKVIHAKSRKQIMDIVLDVNGASYLQEMSAKGFALPYETIRNEFDAYINGKYIGNDGGYTSAMYIDQTDKIEVTTNLVSLLNCKCEVEIPKNTCAMLFLDGNCDVKVRVGSGSVLKLEHWGDSKVEIIGGIRMGIKVTKKG